MVLGPVCLCLILYPLFFGLVNTVSRLTLIGDITIHCSKGKTEGKKLHPWLIFIPISFPCTSIPSYSPRFSCFLPDYLLLLLLLLLLLFCGGRLARRLLR